MSWGVQKKAQKKPQRFHCGLTETDYFMNVYDLVA